MGKNHKTNNIGAAVVGLGRGKSHVKGIIQSEGVDLLAVCDKNEELLASFSKEYAVDTYTNIKDLLQRQDIDLVDVCTPNGMHAEMLTQIAEAGKHAMTEKPLDITLEKIDQAIEAFESRNLKLGCIFQIRLMPAVQLMKKAIDEGRLGKLIVANAHIKWYRTDQYYEQSGGWRGTWALDGGGSLMTQAIHTVDQLRWMIGPVTSVVGVSNVFTHQIETEDTSVALIKFANGALATIVSSTATYPGFGTTLEIHGENGGIGLKDNQIAEWKIKGENMENEKIEVLSKYGYEGRTQGKKVDTTQLQIQDMVDAIRDNRPPLIGDREGRNAVEIVLAIYESSRTGKEIFLPL